MSNLPFGHSYLFNTVRLKTFESVLCLSGPVGSLSQGDVDVLKTAVAKLMVKPPITGIDIYEPHRGKTCHHGFPPGLAQTMLYKHKRWLEA